MADINIGIIKGYLANIAEQRNNVVIDTSLSNDDKAVKLSVFDKENDELLQTFDLYKLMLDDVSDVSFSNYESKMNALIADFQSKIDIFTFPAGGKYLNYLKNSIHFKNNSSPLLGFIRFPIPESTQYTFSILMSSLIGNCSINLSFYNYSSSPFLGVDVNYSNSSFGITLYFCIDSSGNAVVLIKPVDGYYFSAVVTDMLFSISADPTVPEIGVIDSFDDFALAGYDLKYTKTNV